MKTAEEFFKNKIKEQNPNIEIVNLSQELITAEQGMRWAHEFKQLHLHNVVGQSEQLICNTCKSGLIDYPDINRRTCSCGGLGYNVTD